jgi:hypothetical protein
MCREQWGYSWWSALVGMLLCAAADATQVEIVDRVTGQALPIYERDGRAYVAGEPGNEYEIRVRSSAGRRVLAVASIDGVNVVTGETAALSQSGYVLDSYGFVRIEGWRKSLSRTAAFYFTRLPSSYAARTGRAANIGVIGVALFSERIPCCVYEQQPHIDEDAHQSRDEADAAAPATSPQAAGRAERRSEEKLGTGHGRSEYSAASYTTFERASVTPDETVIIYYDSRRNLVAQGIIPEHRHYAERAPQPFPNGFVPDP